MLESEPDLSSFVKALYKLWKSESKSHNLSISLYCFSSSSRLSIFLYQVSFCVTMSSCTPTSRNDGVQGGRIVLSGRQVMVVYDVVSDKDYVLRGAVAMVVDFSKLGSISG